MSALITGLPVLNPAPVSSGPAPLRADSSADSSNVSGTQSSKAQAGTSSSATTGTRTGDTDSADFSPEAREKAKTHDSNSHSTTGQPLTSQQKDEVTKLQERDQHVRAHEAAHQGAGGRYAGAASFTYQTGPDGRKYAIGGEVPIDVSPVKNDPKATIAKMEQVRAAALAPSDPSGADRQVAAQATQIELEASTQEASGEASGADTSSGGEPAWGAGAGSGDSSSSTRAADGAAPHSGSRTGAQGTQPGGPAARQSDNSMSRGSIYESHRPYTGFGGSPSPTSGTSHIDVFA